MEQLSKELLRALRGRVPGVRFRLSALALMGPEALDLGKRLTQEAQGLGFYVLLDVPEADSGELAAFAAGQITGEGSGWACDGVVLPMYAGFDVLQPWLEPCEKQGLDIFALCRTSNRSAAELQDLPWQTAWTPPEPTLRTYPLPLTSWAVAPPIAQALWSPSAGSGRGRSSGPRSRRKWSARRQRSSDM